jgi:2-polyprenyl-3-methyl-5-hydroxy-6-metoxy-1,4-benzoquinol methylase
VHDRDVFIPLETKDQAGTVNIESIRQGKQEIIRRYGDWTAHNIHLGGDVYTIGHRVVGDEIKLKRIVQVISDVCGRPLETLRILDLACLEGLYAVELARRGANVVAIEGREANIEKARFVKQALALDNLELIQDDVRHLNTPQHGQFDVVLCLGILYHLDAPDVFDFLNRIAEVCQRVAIVDTHVSMSNTEFHLFNGKKYWGRSYAEHRADVTPEEKAKTLWASLENAKSFWFTRSSLYNCLSQVGFTSVYECHTPSESDKPYDRVTLLALKGERVTLVSSPLVNASVDEGWPETPKRIVHPNQGGFGAALPGRIKGIFNRLRGICSRSLFGQRP